MLKRALVSLILLLLGMQLHAEIFLVTNNADSGPGSFRDAIERSNANGNSETDRIHFNIPGSSAREVTIMFRSDLPKITSDLIIDASTQPGASISRNDARVIFDCQENLTSVIPFLTVQNEGIFELYATVIRNQRGGWSSPHAFLGFIGNMDRVILGAPNKGNVIYNSRGFYTTNLPQGVINYLELKNNFIGLEEDGITQQLTVSSLGNVRNLIIGGSSKAEGNTIFGVFNINLDNGHEVATGPFNLSVRNNILGANNFEDYLTQPLIGFWVEVDPNLRSQFPASIDISENTFAMQIGFSYLRNANIVIQRNRFGTSSDLTKALPLPHRAIQVNDVQGRVLIGGPTETEGNIFTNVRVEQTESTGRAVIDVINSNTVEVSRNSFYCNPELPLFYADKEIYAHPAGVSLDNLNSTTVKGRATPGAAVELYYSDAECNNCQPKRYFATVITDLAGNWEYSGVLEAGYSVIASATLNNSTSEFSTPVIYVSGSLTDPVRITPQSCNGADGKIEGVVVVNGTTVEWLNEAGYAVGSSIDLIGVPAGRYRLKVGHFGCTVFSQWIRIPLSNVVFNPKPIPEIIHPACGNPGSIVIADQAPGPVTDAYWVNANGVKVGSFLRLTTAVPGTYTYRIIALSGCQQEFGPYTLTNQSGPVIDDLNALITPSGCTTSRGSIKDLAFTGTGVITYKWTNDQQVTVGTSADLENMPAGIYKLEIADQSACGLISKNFTIPILNNLAASETGLSITGSGCTISTGSIKGLTATGTGTIRYKWTNNQQANVGSTREIENMPAGNYTVEITDDNGCTPIIKTYVIPIQNNLALSETGLSITGSGCTVPTGSIRGLTVTGTGVIRYKWMNAQQAIVGTTREIENLPAGSYSLEVTDNNGCTPIVKDYIIPVSTVLTLSETGVSLTPASCLSNTGNISGISVSGSSAFRWVNEQGSIIATTLQLQALPGKYRFIAEDQGGCTVTSALYEITKDIVVYPDFPVTLKPATCGVNNASAAIAVSGPDQPAAIRWQTATGQPVGTGVTVSNLPAGNYNIYFDNTSGCETLFKTITLATVAPLVFSAPASVTADVCALALGRIDNITITGGTAPYRYTWESGSTILNNNTASAQGLLAGNYRLTVEDENGCSISADFQVNNNTENLQAPLLDQVTVCTPMKIIAGVKNFRQGGLYKLFADELSSTPIATSTDGNFDVTVTETTTFYVSFAYGACESPRGPLDVTVALNGLVVPASFSPNGDGVNDTWSVTGLDNYPAAITQIFNRFGSKIFEYKGANMKFDGKHNGEYLSPGTYYYIIVYSDMCPKLSGSLFVFR